VCFVASLYIWKNDKDRDNPETIRRRFISMAFCCIISPLVLVAFVHYFDQGKANYLAWLGFSPVGFLPALIFPLTLTGTLFLGPLVDELILHPDHDTYSLSAFVDFFCDLRNIRNYVVAPLAEELVFRVCILSILVYSGWSHTVAGVIAPLMFGFAHLHHVHEHMRHAGYGVSRSMKLAGFQACYTTLFGIYASFLFLRTSNLMAPFLSHAFCNRMGFPEFQRLSTSKYKNVLTAAYLAGITGFFALLMPITEPSWYNPYIWTYVAT